jgi:hypothetical protein
VFSLLDEAGRGVITFEASGSCVFKTAHHNVFQKKNFTASDCHHMFAKPNGQERSIEQIKRQYREVFYKKYDQFIFFEESGSCVF